MVLLSWLLLSSYGSLGLEHEAVHWIHISPSIHLSETCSSPSSSKHGFVQSKTKISSSKPLETWDHPTVDLPTASTVPTAFSSLSGPCITKSQIQPNLAFPWSCLQNRCNRGSRARSWRSTWLLSQRGHSVFRCHMQSLVQDEREAPSSRPGNSTFQVRA
ncbi:hypothetical protein F5Y15DRAFT_199866 [Xylariaceae sp. FL0016]|nr:hypothetical protein F5Y15DRAFT_199866 [Xylariaceae sp. FL0016]